MKYLPFVLRNLGCNKVRSLLTAAAIALAIALVCILRTMPAGMDAFLNAEKGFIGNFFGSLKGIVAMILIVAGIVTLCIVFIAANTASMSVRERAGEIAILKAIGFRKQTIFTTLLAEAVVLSTIAGLVGALLSLGLTQLLRANVGAGNPAQLGLLTGFVVTDAILVQAIFLAFFIGILSGWLPALGASRRSVAQTLREVF